MHDTNSERIAIYVCVYIIAIYICIYIHTHTHIYIFFILTLKTNEISNYNRENDRQSTMTFQNVNRQ